MGSIQPHSGRLLPRIVDDVANKSPDLIFCIHPTSQSTENGWRRITYRSLANAVNRVAWWINRQLGAQKSRTPQVLAYIGTNDLRYVAFVLGCLKAGQTPYLLSTRNSQTAFHYLFKAKQCSVLVDASEKIQLRQTIDELEASWNLQSSTDGEKRNRERWRMPPMWDIFGDAPAEPYPYEKTYPEVKGEVAMILHSSGTTGHPKPVDVTHGYLATIDNMRHLPIPPGRETGQMFLRWQGHLRFLYGPFFHFLGTVCYVECIFYQTPFLLAPDRPLTADSLSRIMASDNPPQWGLISPYALQELCATASGRNALSRFSAFNFGGAPIGQEVGEMVSSLVHLQALFGSTETGYTPTLMCEEPTDWGYLEWNPAFGVRMDESSDGLWELVISRPDGECCYHGIFQTYPHLTEYHTGDLFRPHPSKNGLWRYAGRADDIIVLSNGEKFNPIDAEKIIESHDLVNRAFISGQSRFQAALLIQPQWDKLPTGWTLENVKNELRPTLEAANAVLPSHGKLLESHIALASPDRPFATTPKGSLSRPQISTTYQDILDGLHAPVVKAHAHEPRLGKPSEYKNLQDIERWVAEAVSGVMNLDTPPHLDDDLIMLGMDSLQTAQLVRILHDISKRAHPLHHEITWTSPKVYDVGTVRGLAEIIQRHISDMRKASEEGGLSPSWSRSSQLTRSIWNHAQLLGGGGITIALTGSTGELGSYLLHELLQDPSISQIYCLNRSPDAAARQVDSFRQKGLSTGWILETSRVHFWQTRLDAEGLGLSVPDYNRLRDSIDLVLHNAWMVNFNQPLRAFEPQLTGVRRLLQLVEQSPRQAALHFISSISTVSNWHPNQGDIIPEALHDDSVVLHQGYAESKFVAESLCAIAARRSGHIPISIHRVGQLGGPSSRTSDTAPGTAMWNTRDWFPALVRSSQFLGLLPESLGSIPVDWVSIDTAAQIITQIIQSQQQQRSRKNSSLHTNKDEADVFHIANLQSSEWDTLAPVVALACSAKLVPLEDWLGALQERASQADDSELKDRFPALQLLDFFRGLVSRDNQMRPPVQVSNTKQHSAAMRTLRPVDIHLMYNWLQQWKQGGWITGHEI